MKISRMKLLFAGNGLLFAESVEKYQEDYYESTSFRKA